MRKAVQALLLMLAFSIPWEYALDLGDRMGNVARVVELLLLAVGLPTLLYERHVRAPGRVLGAVLALYLWFCMSYYWSLDPATTFTKMRAYLQEMLLVWIVWEFASSAAQMRNLLRAYVAGSWVLAVLNIVALLTTDDAAQSRFVASGQDPNDVARFLDMAIPLAALLLGCERNRFWRLIAAGYLFYGPLGVLLTASRGGFVAGIFALAGAGLVLLHAHKRWFLAVAMLLPLLAGLLWSVVPGQNYARLATIGEQLRTGDLNQRINIWIAGWHAFERSPLLGWGAGCFVAATGTNPHDTAHNTALSLAVHGGLVALMLALVLLVLLGREVLRMRGALRLALASALAVWLTTALVAGVEESRSTWFFFGMIALGARLAVELPRQLDAEFSAPSVQEHVHALA